MTTAADAWTEPLVRQLIKRHGGRTPEEVIERYARQLLEAGDQCELPTDVEGLASLHGIRTRVRSLEFAGRIYADDSGQLLMDLNADDSEARKRFTIGHELMHTAFPGFKAEGRYRVDDGVGHHTRARAEEEYLCDLGAAALLMPREIVVRDYSADGGLRAVERLARDADVSLEAAGNRLVALSDKPLVFLVLELMHKPADTRLLRRGESVPEQLRVRYGTVSGLDYYLPKFKSVDPDGVLSHALQVPNRVQGRGALPGANRAFEIEAKSYPIGQRTRVLAIASPSGSE